MSDLEHNPFADAVSPLTDIAAPPTVRSDERHGAGAAEGGGGGAWASPPRSPAVGSIDTATRQTAERSPPLSSQLAQSPRPARSLPATYADVDTANVSDDKHGGDSQLNTRMAASLYLGGARPSRRPLSQSMVLPKRETVTVDPLSVAIAETATEDVLAAQEKRGGEMGAAAVATAAASTSPSSSTRPATTTGGGADWADINLGSVADIGPKQASPRRKTGGAAAAEEAGAEETRDNEPLFFDVAVSEPVRVGDAMNAHVVYKVTTKTNSKRFAYAEITVRRRYSDFLWLYNQLTEAHPGIIVPPVPEKHAIGRFEGDFIEGRRLALERCLKRVLAHKTLRWDADLRVFLESDSFTNHVNLKKRESKSGFFKSIGDVLGGSFNKFYEVDESRMQWFEKRQEQLVAIDGQLRALHKSTTDIVKQRKDLAAVYGDLSKSLDTLAAGERHTKLADGIKARANMHKYMQELCDQQACKDLAVFESMAAEYVRILGSIKNAFDSRAKAYLAWQSSMVELDKRRLSLERLRATLRPSPATAFNAANDTSRHTALRAEITALELRTFAREREFRRVSDTLRDELARFEYERTEEFVAVVAKYLDSLIAMQREVVTLWRALVARGRGEEARVGEGGRSEDASNSASNSMTRTGNVADATDSATAASATTNGDDGASAFTGQNEAIYYRSGEGPPF